MNSDADRESDLVLILAPSGRDAKLTATMLVDAGLHAATCADIADLCSRMGDGAATALVDERALNPDAIATLSNALQHQGDWSDFPIVVFSEVGSRSRKPRVHPEVLGNVTFLDRPVQIRTMIAAVQAAVRARKRQYQVKRAIALREQFLAMLGHELRNPVASIRLAIETMGVGGDSRRQYDVIDRQSQHLSRLVDDLLDVARVTHGKVVLQRAPVDLCELVQACFNALVPTAEANALSYSLSGDPQCWVDGDRLRLEQIVNNLLTNAIKYTPKGGSVRAVVRAEGERVRLSVEDTGIGMTAETVDRVFDLFAQADRSLDRAQGGLGLGLTVVRSLVELHDGTVEAWSEGLGRGSRFVVLLPRAQPGAVEEERPPALAHADNPRRVVVVDDNDDLREMLEVFLVSAGHEVITAEDGPSGLERILDRHPDVALVDLGLPGFDGYELARRARAAGSASVLVAVSGYGQPDDRKRALAAGFDEHLKKPVAFQDLSSALRLHH